MKQTILLAIALFAFSSTVNAATDLQQENSIENTASESSQSTSSEPIEKVSPKKSTSDKIKYTTTQWGVQCKDLAVRTFTIDNVMIIVEYAQVALIALIYTSYETVLWLIDTLSSSRDTLTTPKPKEKTD